MASNRIYLDFETRSALDIKNHGAARYAADPSTGINCIVWALNDGPLNLIPYGDGKPDGAMLSLMLTTFLLTENCKFVAHNAAFEASIMKWVLGRDCYRPEFWIDTMAKCAYHGLPLGLDDAAKALKLPILKDLGGKAVMQVLATGKYTPDNRPGDFKTLYKYCGVDVEVLRLIDKAVPDLPPEVQERWELDAEINMRGIPIDTTMVDNAIKLRAIFQERDNETMNRLTGGAVQSVGQVAEIQKWVAGQGADMVDCTADTVLRTINSDIPEQVRTVLQLRQEAGLSSLAKFQKMKDYLVGNRLHGMFFWYGAHTGRPTGSGPQMLNLTRSADDFEYWADLLVTNPWYFTQVSSPSEKLKDCIRGAVCAPPGYAFVGMDLSQIEARATGWAALCDQFLQLFLTTDPYCTYGKTLFGHEIDKKKHPEKRNAAKAAVLAFGFAGGIGAGQRIGENYNFDFNSMADFILPTATPDELAIAHRCYKYYLRSKPIKPLTEREALAVDVLKQRYRKDFPEITAYWDTLENAFLNGGQANRINVEVRGGGLRVVTLPSGRQLFYHGVRSDMVPVTDEDTGEEKLERKFSYQGRHGRKWFWKGTLIENIAQAINQDVSDWYKLRANKTIAPVVHHCYDEFTMLVPEGEVDAAVEKLKVLLATKPDYCEGLPIGFDWWVGKRYGK